MDLQQMFFGAYVGSLAPACRVFFTEAGGVWYIDQSQAGYARRKANFQDLLKEPWAPGQLDAEIMVNGADPLETYELRASTGDVFGVPPANEPGLGQNPGYALPGATPQPGQQAYPTSALPGWLPVPPEAAMKAYLACTTEDEAKSFLGQCFPPYKGVAA